MNNFTKICNANTTKRDNCDSTIRQEEPKLNDLQRSVISAIRSQFRCHYLAKLSRFYGLIIPTLLFSATTNANLFTVKVSPYCSNTQTIGAGSGVPLRGDQMVNVLDEEFNGTSLNQNIWRVAEDSAADTNNTLQANTPNNYQVKNGALKLFRKTRVLHPT